MLFFPSGDPAVALIASFATFAVGYVARPVGAVVMGHFGDRIGRKLVMLAPVLLVVLRAVPGFSAHAESAGASTLGGYAVGCSLATIVFLPVALLPAEQDS